MKDVRELLNEQRKVRDPLLEIALQDFAELNEFEQRELIFGSLVMLSANVAWLLLKSKIQ